MTIFNTNKERDDQFKNVTKIKNIGRLNLEHGLSMFGGNRGILAEKCSAHLNGVGKGIVVPKMINLEFQ